MKTNQPNRLINEKSPYLLQHSLNPVQWYPWGEEALKKSKEEDKPIFLSIGYSTCHWCHVMHNESFENEEIARILNTDFVPIKVDREERPDLDEVYMKAVTTLTGQGGWPLSVFLTPGLKPFYGGTYFPPVPRHGLPGFPQVLGFISNLWKDKRDEVLENAEELTRAVRENYALKSQKPATAALMDDAYAVLASSFDPEYGGYGGPPKFPLPSYIQFMLRYYLRTRKELALKSVVKTLGAMAMGGIHDHLGGGFHRYSTDRRWLVPHFEKMLYDNALLAIAYLEAYQLTQDRSFMETARDTLDWILREMTGREGGFFSAQDADTAEGEGFFYTWTPDEIASVLGTKASEIFMRHYGVTPEGNFEGRSILHLSSTKEETAGKFNIDEAELVKLLGESRRKLLDARSRRSRPAVDDKILTSWSSLAISALSRAYQGLGDERYLVSAKSAASFVLTKLWTDGKLRRRFREGEAAIEGNLEDYAFLVQGLLDLYEAGFEPRHLQSALELERRMIELFWDDEGGGFFLNSTEGDLPARIKDGYDGPTPSGNSVAALDLLRLWELTGEESLREKAEMALRIFAERMENEPSAHTYMLLAVDFLAGPRKEVVVASEGAGAEAFVREIQRRFIPNKVMALAGSPSIPEISSLVEGKGMVAGKPTVYICENFSCKRPITDLEALRNELGP